MSRKAAIVKEPVDEPAADLDLRWLVEGPIAYWDAMIRLQRMQTEFLATLERQLGQANREAWDQWACRWGGGVPLEP